MKLLQNNVLGVNKLNCFKATQVLGGPTYIDIGVRKLARHELFYWLNCILEKSQN